MRERGLEPVRLDAWMGEPRPQTERVGQSLE
jgi:hypothetical protein